LTLPGGRVSAHTAPTRYHNWRKSPTRRAGWRAPL